MNADFLISHFPIIRIAHSISNSHISDSTHVKEKQDKEEEMMGDATSKLVIVAELLHTQET